MRRAGNGSLGAPSRRRQASVLVFFHSCTGSREGKVSPASGGPQKSICKHRFMPPATLSPPRTCRWPAMALHSSGKAAMARGRSRSGHARGPHTGSSSGTASCCSPPSLLVSRPFGRKISIWRNVSHSAGVSRATRNMLVLAGGCDKVYIDQNSNKQYYVHWSSFAASKETQYCVLGRSGNIVLPSKVLQEKSA